MIRSYTEYLFEKEEGKSSPEKVSDPFYWIGESVANIKELTNIVVGLGGFTNDEGAKKIMSSVDDAERKGIQTEVLSSVKSLVEYMINKPKKEWSINGVPVNQNISLPLKDALDYILVAIEKTEKGIKDLKDFNQPSQQGNAKQKKTLARFLEKVIKFGETPINLDFSKTTEKINSTVRSLTDPDKPESKDVFANNIRYSLKSINDSVESMKMLANSIKGFDTEGISEDIKELDSISEIVLGNMESLKGEKFKSSDLNSANKASQEQRNKLDKFRERFFAKYSRYIQENTEYEGIKKNISDARNKIDGVQGMIETSKEASKIFKGYDRDVLANLDSKSEDIVSGILGKPDDSIPDEGAEDLTNKKDKLKVDDKLGKILGKEPGDYQTSMKSLKELINGKN